MFGLEKKTEIKSGPLTGKKVAAVATNGFEESELFDTKKALEDAGARVDVISVEEGKILGWRTDDWGSAIGVDKTIEEVSAMDYDALLLPGGVMNADELRGNALVVRFVKEFVSAAKPIAAICHALWTLIEAEGVKGRRVTSWHTLKTDLRNAGALWVDEQVVTDKGLVTSRKPADIPTFNKKMIEEFCEGPHQQQIYRSEGVAI